MSKKTSPGGPSDWRDAFIERHELPEDYREPLIMQVLLGMTTDEIATAMDLRQGAVLTRLHRARKKLADILQTPEEQIS